MHKKEGGISGKLMNRKTLARIYQLNGLAFRKFAVFSVQIRDWIRTKDALMCAHARLEGHDFPEAATWPKIMEQLNGLCTLVSTWPDKRRPLLENV